MCSEDQKQADGLLRIQVKKKKKNKNPLPVPAIAVCRPKAMSCKLTCSQSSSLVAQNSRGREKINNENTTTGTVSGCLQAQGHEL
jgi:hypothetical protein